MSNKFTTQQIQAQFASLPADMQNAISSSDTANLIQDIGGKHGLRIDAIGVLIEYSGLIMLGLIRSDEFVDALVRETGIKREQAANLALDIDTQVFNKVRNSIKQVQYQSTSDKRFEQNPDFQKPAPKPAETEQAIDEIAEDPIAPELNMASADYDPSSFASAQAPDQSQTEGINPIATTGTSALDKAVEQLDGAFETAKPSPEGPIPIQLNTSPNDTVAPGYDSASVEQEVSRSVAEEVIKGMPEAVQDAYKAGRAAAPAPAASAEVIKDFQTRLEEKIAQTDTTVVNSDPYKESI